MKNILILIVFIVCANAQAQVREYSEYFTIAASQTDAAIGVGVKGNFLKRLTCTVATAATSTVSFKDGSGSSAIPLIAANTAIGVYDVDLEIRAKTESSPGFYVTTGAGVSCIAVGRFAAIAY